MWKVEEKIKKFVTNFSNLSILIKELIKVMPLVESESNIKLKFNSFISYRNNEIYDGQQGGEDREVSTSKPHH